MAKDNKLLWKKFFLLCVPCVIFWASIIYFSFFEWEITILGDTINKTTLAIFIEGFIEAFIAFWGQPFMWIIGEIILLLPVIAGFAVFAYGVIGVYCLFMIPYDAFVEGIVIGHIFIWLMVISFPLTLVSAFKFELGKIEADSSYVSGYHYETEYKECGGEVKAVTKEVAEYSGGGEWVHNLLIYILRIICIRIAGIIIFLIFWNKNKKA